MVSVIHTSKTEKGNEGEAGTTRKRTLEDVMKDAGTPDNVKKCLKAILGTEEASAFIKIFNGRIGKLPLPAARVSLCETVAAQTGSDQKLIEAVFRESAVYDEGLTGKEVRGIVEDGIEAADKEEKKKHKSHPPFIVEKKGKESVNCPLLAEYIKKHVTFRIVRAYDDPSPKIYVYRDGVYEKVTDDDFRGIIGEPVRKYRLELLTSRLQDETFKLITRDPKIHVYTPDEVNSDERYINFRNGLLRLSDLVLLPHTPDVFYTIQIACNWRKTEVPTPVFDRYMHTLCGGDAATIRLLTEFLGCIISNVDGVRFKKSLFLHGDGNTGKSQYKLLAENLVGRNAFASLGLKDLEERFGAYDLFGKRLAGQADLSFMTIGELAVFKTVTGGDNIKGERKHKDPFPFRYHGFLVFCMNRLPRFGGDNGQWVYDRIIPVACDNVVPVAERDPDILPKMLAEAEGICRKAVMAVKDVIAHGYKLYEPERITEGRSQYRCENNSAISFWEECMVPLESETACKRTVSGKHDPVTTHRVFEAYRKWCRDNNRGYFVTEKEFRDDLCKHLDVTYDRLVVRRSSGMVYRGYTLSADAFNTYTD